MISRAIIGHPRSVVIEYVDAQGEGTVREIVARMLGGTMQQDVFLATYVIADCRLARARRTFRVDRIGSVSDPGSGELIDLALWVRSLDLAPIAAADTWEPGDVAEESDRPRSSRGAVIWWIIAALLVGYGIGRFRVVHFLAHLAGWRWARSL